MNTENDKRKKVETLKQLISHNSLFLKVVSIVVVAIAIISVIITTILVYISDEVYIETYSHANRKIVSQINDDYYFLHEDIMEVLAKCNRSTSLKSFFGEKELTPQEQTKVIYGVVSGLKDTSLIGINLSTNLLLVGSNGKTTYLNNAGRVDDYESILNSEVVQIAKDHGKEIIYQYSEDGFTSDTKGVGVIHVIKTLYDENNEFLGIADVMIKHSDFKSLYEPLIDEANNGFYIADENGYVLSSNRTEKIGTVIEEYLDTADELIESNEATIRNRNMQGQYTLLAKEMGFNNLHLISVIDESNFVDKINRLSTVFITTLFLVIITIIIVFLFIRKAMSPIRLISDKMQYITQGDFSNHIDVQGSGQVRELEQTYNYMLDGLNRYVDELMQIQEEKRLSDIHALQMQINPHFIYNTLTSIKFLVWKGDKEKATQTIDSFIQLLRMTIGSKKDIIPLHDEIANAENYIQIQQTRYGDKVKHRLFIDEETRKLLVPKMLIQPFIENAFIHAFEDMTHGVIDIYAKISKYHLVIEIIDNGCGMEVTHLDQLMVKKNKSNQFSGIGIHNVDERIKLLYGEQFGVRISSAKDKGTIITIELPVLKEVDTEE